MKPKANIGHPCAVTINDMLCLFTDENSEADRVDEGDILVLIDEFPWQNYPSWCCVLSKLGIRYIQSSYFTKYTRQL